MDSATGMMIDGQQAFAIIGTVLWAMLRIGAMLMAMPMVGSRAVPARVRGMLALVLSMALAPLLPPVPVWNGFDAAAILTIAPFSGNSDSAAVIHPGRNLYLQFFPLAVAAEGHQTLAAGGCITEPDINGQGKITALPWSSAEAASTTATKGTTEQA